MLAMQLLKALKSAGAEAENPEEGAEEIVARAHTQALLRSVGIDQLVPSLAPPLKPVHWL